MSSAAAGAEVGGGAAGESLGAAAPTATDRTGGGAGACAGGSRVTGGGTGRAVAATAAVAGVAALGVFFVDIGTPSPWRDEVVSAVVAGRGPGGVLALARHVDLVHATYYLLAIPWVGGEAGVVGLRVLSAVAFAAAVAVTVLVAARLVPERGAQPGSRGSTAARAAVGAFAAALVVVAPVASRYAQEARSYALVTLAATVATLLLVVSAGMPRRPRAATIGYAASVVVLVLLNTLAVLLLVGHLLYLALVRGPRARRTLVALLVAGAALTPFLLATLSQSGQVDWLPRPDVTALRRVATAAWGDLPQVAVALGLPVLALAVPGARQARPGLVLALGWGWLPPVLLWTVSQVHPFFDQRYLVHCVPGAALAVALAVVALGRAAADVANPRTAVVGAVAVAVALTGVVAVQGLDRQRAMRSADGHVENLRATADLLARLATPGEPVVYEPDNLRLVALAYPDRVSGLDDVALCRAGAASATIVGEPCPTDVVAQRLGGAASVLVVERAVPPPSGTETPSGVLDLLRGKGFSPALTMVQDRGFRVTRWVRP